MTVIDLEEAKARRMRDLGPAPWVTPKDIYRLVRLRDGRVDFTDQRHTAEKLRSTGNYRVERYLLVETQEQTR